MLWSPTTAAAPSLRAAVHSAHGRWKIEQYYRELKDELGLDHFEGRGWLGWHYAPFIQDSQFGRSWLSWRTKYWSAPHALVEAGRL